MTTDNADIKLLCYALCPSRSEACDACSSSASLVACCSPSKLWAFALEVDAQACQQSIPISQFRLRVSLAIPSQNRHNRFFLLPGGSACCWQMFVFQTKGIRRSVAQSPRRSTEKQLPDKFGSNVEVPNPGCHKMRTVACSRPDDFESVESHPRTAIQLDRSDTNVSPCDFSKVYRTHRADNDDSCEDRMSRPSSKGSFGW